MQTEDMNIECESYKWTVICHTSPTSSQRTLGKWYPSACDHSNTVQSTV